RRGRCASGRWCDGRARQACRRCDPAGRRLMNYDAIIIGAGHNGLVAANYLAKTGKKVLVLERRDVAGGQLVTESFGDGFAADSLHASAQLRPDIVRDLGLQLPVQSARPPYVCLLGDGKRLTIDADPERAR